MVRARRRPGRGLWGDGLAEARRRMKYLSTRGQAPPVGFVDALLAGLAPDGGLYMPDEWPVLSADEIAAFAGAPYAEVAADILGRFAGDEIAPQTLGRLASDAYATFSHAA